MNQIKVQTAVAQRPSRATFVRRRILVLAAIVLAVFGAATMLTGQAQATVQIGSASEFTYVAVHNGDDLWSLADRYAGDQDRRDWVAKLVSLNALESNTLQPGQRLALPNH